MSKKIIVLNAPPRTGKDTVADLFQEACPNVKRASFKWPLFDIFVNTCGMQMEEFLTLYELEGWKDTPSDALNGKSPRDLMIHISENFIKPFFGDRYFGDWISDFIALHEQQNEDEMDWIIPDGGFDAEIKSLASRFPGRVVVVQFTRDGFTDFGTDSRGWISQSLIEDDVTFVQADTTKGNDHLVAELKRRVS